MEDIPSGLSVFLGQNEAGKSTLLAFLRYMLFGFPQGRSKENRYPPLLGGRHGGRLFLETDSFGSVTLERFSDRREPFLTGPSSQIPPAQGLKTLLGGLTRQIFQNVFAFSLTELQSFSSLEAQEIKSALYGAALGTGGIDIAKIESELQKRLDELFRPRGSKPAINKALSEFSALKAQIKQAADQVERYRQITLELKELDAKESKISRGIDELLGQKQCLQEFSWILKELNKLKDLSNKISLIRPDEKILALRDQILSVEGRKEAYRGILRQIKEIEAEIEGLEAGIVSDLGSLGLSWSKDKLRSFDRSFFTRQALDELSSRIDQAQSSLDQVRVQLRACEQALSHVGKRIERIKGRIQDLEENEFVVDQQVLNALRSKRDYIYGLFMGLSNEEKMLANLQEELSNSIREIDPEWDLEHLLGFDTSLQARDKIALFEKEFSQRKWEIRDLQARRQMVLKELSRCQELINNKEDDARRLGSLIDFSEDEITNRENEVSNLFELKRKAEELSGHIKSLYEQIDRIEKQISVETNELNEAVATGKAWSLWGPFGLLGVGAALFGVNLYSKDLVQGSLSLFVCAVAALLLHLLIQRQTKGQTSKRQIFISQKQSQVKEAKELLRAKKKEASDIEEQMACLSKALGLGASCSLSEIRNFEGRLSEQRLRLNSMRMLQSQIDELSRQLKDNQAQILQIERAISEKRMLLDKEMDKWACFLKDLGLRTDLDPATVFSVLAKVQGAKAVLRQVRQQEERVAAHKAQIDAFMDLARSLGIFSDQELKDPDTLFIALDSVFEKWEQQQQKSQQAKEANAALRDLFSEKKELEAEIFRLEQEKNRCEQDLHSAKKTLSTWLSGLGLPKDLSVKSSYKALDTIERAISALELQDNRRAKLERLAEEKGRFKEDVKRLLSELGMVQTGLEDVIAGVHLLSQALHVATRKAEERQRLEWERDHLYSQLKERWSVFSRRVRALSDQAKKAAGLWRETSTMSLFSTEEMPDPDELFNLVKSLRISDSDLFKAKIEQIENEISELEQLRQALYKQRASFLHEKAELSASDQLLELRIKQEAIKARIRELAEQWGLYAVSLYLLKRARSEFEKEHQPKVLMDASSIFSRITGGRYCQIIAPLSGNGLQIIDATGQVKDLSTLSRGTSEQLYLALRFAYIKNYSFGGEVMPVIMDDILVNFDPMRARLASQAICELSKERQVLFFTCHPNVAGLLSQVAEKVFQGDSAQRPSRVFVMDKGIVTASQ